MTMRRQIPGQLTLPLVPGLSRRTRSSLVRRIVVGWQNDAACSGYPDVSDFYPDGYGAPASRRITDLKGICAFCPVVRSCLSAALVADEQGVWGRTTEVQRDAIREELAHGTDVDAALNLALDGPLATWGIAA